MHDYQQPRPVKKVNTKNQGFQGSLSQPQSFYEASLGDQAGNLQEEQFVAFRQSACGLVNLY